MYGVGIGTGATGVAAAGAAMGSNVLMAVAAVMMAVTAITLRRHMKRRGAHQRP